jgi:hypothetical protein
MNACKLVESIALNEMTKYTSNNEYVLYCHVMSAVKFLLRKNDYCIACLEIKRPNTNIFIKKYNCAFLTLINHNKDINCGKS